MGNFRFFLPAIALIMVVFAVERQAGTVSQRTAPLPSISDSIEQRSDSAAVTEDSAAIALPQPSSSCTLEVTTDPQGASVSFDGEPFENSPFERQGLSPGKHTLVFQKPGYFQKKAIVDLPAARKTALHFQLSAPGRLTLVSEPPEADIFVNGKLVGKTPFADSLIRPGIYRVALHKEHYLPVEDTLIIESGGWGNMKDTLVLADSYRDSLRQAAAASKTRQKHYGIGMVAGAFVAFLLVLLGVELQEMP